MHLELLKTQQVSLILILNIVLSSMRKKKYIYIYSGIHFLAFLRNTPSNTNNEGTYYLYCCLLLLPLLLSKSICRNYEYVVSNKTFCNQQLSMANVKTYRNNLRRTHYRVGRGCNFKMVPSTYMRRRVLRAAMVRLN